MSLERALPYDERAEQGVLAGLLVDPSAIVRLLGWLQPEDFFRQMHREVYRAMTDCAARGEPTDFVLVCAALAQRRVLDRIGGEAALAALLPLEYSAAHVEQYAHRVERAAIARRLIEASGVVARAAYDGWEADDLAAAVDRAEAAVLAVDQRRRGAAFTATAALMADYFDRLSLVARGEVPSGVATGFADLDRVTGGLQPGELTILAARPGQGKSALAMAMAEHAARAGIGAGVFSLEMGKDSLAHRMVSAAAKVDGYRLRTGQLHDDDWRRVTRALGELGSLPLYVDASGGLTLLEVRARSRRLCAEQTAPPVGLLVVDYLQLLHGSAKAESRVQEVGEISRGLKALAMELKLPVLACAQLNRAVEQRADGRPQLSDLRESGSIEQDADVVLFLWRDPQTPPELIDVAVAKNRNGPLSDLRLVFRREWTRFENYAAHYDPGPTGPTGGRA